MDAIKVFVWISSLFLLKMVVEIQCFKCELFYLAPQDFVFSCPASAFTNSAQEQSFPLNFLQRFSSLQGNAVH